MHEDTCITSPATVTDRGLQCHSLPRLPIASAPPSTFCQQQQRRSKLGFSFVQVNAPYSQYPYLSASRRSLYTVRRKKRVLRPGGGHSFRPHTPACCDLFPAHVPPDPACFLRMKNLVREMTQ